MTAIRIATLVALSLAATSLAAQDIDSPQESRSDLTVAAQDAETMATKEGSADKKNAFLERARRLRNRLTNGDLRVGDQVVIEVISPIPEMSALADTFRVGPGQTLQLHGIRDVVPLKGVLRSELTEHITTHLKRDFRNPQIRTKTLIGIIITGQVTAPGARLVAPDALLRDVALEKGSILPTANYDKIVVKRDGKPIVAADSMRAAIAHGLTIDDLGIEGGDEIDVGMKRRPTFLGIVQVTSVMLGLALTIVSLRGR